VSDPEKSLFWFATNTSKRGITLNIEVSDGQELFKRLAKTADIVVESFEPGYMDFIGLAYASLKAVKHDIIFTSITSFGQTGPYAHYQATDLVGAAMAAWPASWATWADLRCAWAPTPSPTSTPDCRARWAP